MSHFAQSLESGDFASTSGNRCDGIVGSLLTTILGSSPVLGFWHRKQGKSAGGIPSREETVRGRRHTASRGIQDHEQMPGGVVTCDHHVMTHRRLVMPEHDDERPATINVVVDASDPVAWRSAKDRDEVSGVSQRMGEHRPREPAGCVRLVGQGPLGAHPDWEVIIRGDHGGRGEAAVVLRALFVKRDIEYDRRLRQSPRGAKEAAEWCTPGERGGGRYDDTNGDTCKAAPVRSAAHDKCTGGLVHGAGVGKV